MSNIEFVIFTIHVLYNPLNDGNVFVGSYDISQPITGNAHIASLFGKLLVVDIEHLEGAERTVNSSTALWVPSSFGLFVCFNLSFRQPSFVEVHPDRYTQLGNIRSERIAKRYYEIL